MPIHVAAYIEQLQLSRASVRQHLSAISRCFDWLVSGGTLDMNPATSVQRPRHVVRVGRTPVLSDDEPVRCSSRSPQTGSRDCATVR